MCHLYLYVEGQTEQTFADTVLKPHLAGFGVYLMGAVLAEFGRRKRHVFRGGVARYEPFRRGLVNLMKQHDRPGVFFSTMTDLYKIPNDFPGAAGVNPALPPDERVKSVEAALGQELGDPRLIPYIQLHEYEALLFVRPRELELFYPERAAELDALQVIADAHPSPEWIDGGEPPSKRIIAQFPDYEGAKPVVGPQVAELIGLAALREKCPHFGQWVSELEGIAARAN